MAISAVRRPLDTLLGAPSRVAVLRVLAAQPAPMSQRELARRAGVQVRSAQQAVEALTALGVAVRSVGGRDHLVRFNDRHVLAPALIALFDAEAGAFRDLRAALVQAAPAGRGRGLAALALFGSAARAEDTPASDLDVLLIATDANGVDDVRDAFERASGSLREAFGVRPRVLAYGLAEARARYRARRPPFDTLVVDAVSLIGPPLHELLA